MTGQKNRHSTVEKLWNLDDKQLTTPKHDEMVIWLLNQDYVATLIPEVKVYCERPYQIMSKKGEKFLEMCRGLSDKSTKKNGKLTEDEIIPFGWYLAEEVPGFLSDQIKGTWEDCISYIHEKTHFEFKWKGYVEIENGNVWYSGCTTHSSVSGDVDYTPLVRKIEREKLDQKCGEVLSTYHKLITQKQKPPVDIRSEVPIHAQNGFLAGYWDIVIFPDKKPEEWHSSIIIKHEIDENFMMVSREWRVPKPIYIEVKPKITSFGETLRQLRTYLDFEPAATDRLYLFTNDLRFKDAFESQGIKVLSQNEGEEKKEGTT